MSRALVIFTDGQEVSPTVYLHWAGTEVPDLIQRLAALMDERKGDLQYAAARFVGICHDRDPNSNKSLGMWNTEADLRTEILTISAFPSREESARKIAQYSHGNSGLVIVNVNDFSWAAYGGTLAKQPTAA